MQGIEREVLEIHCGNEPGIPWLLFCKSGPCGFQPKQMTIYRADTVLDGLRSPALWA